MAAAPVQHVVVIVKENHTFDNYFGAFQGANGVILPPAANPPAADQSHTHYSWTQRYYGVAANLQYGQQDIPGYWELASKFTLCDNYFSEVAGPSTPNHLMLVAAASPTIQDSPTPSTPDLAYVMPNVPAKLTAAGLTWGAYGGFPYPFSYIAGLPTSNGHTPATFAKDAKAGTLPSVSWVYAPSGYSEHPPQNITDGMRWTMQQVEAVASGPLWASSMIFITWDDWGGWYDHVESPMVEQWWHGNAQHDSDTYKSYDGDQFRYGPRVPCLVVGPYAKSGHVSHQLLSHVSIPRYIEDLFGLTHCSGRDGSATGFTDCFDYTQTPSPPYTGSY